MVSVNGRPRTDAARGIIVLQTTWTAFQHKRPWTDAVRGFIWLQEACCLAHTGVANITVNIN